MSSHDFDPTRNPASAGEQVPHSGVHHDEQPVREFDKTPLHEAPIDRNLPHGVTTGHLPEDMRPETKKGKKGLLIGAGSTLAALALGTGLFLGLDRGGNSNSKTAPNTEVGTSAPANPGAEQSGSTSGAETSPETTLYPASVEQSQLYKQLTPEQQAQVDSYHNMSVGQFEQLPLDQRLAYAQFVYDVYEPGAVAGLKENESRFIPAPDTLSDQSKGQDILNSNNIKRSTAFWALASNGKMNVINDANRSDAEKMASLRFLATTGDEYTKAVQDIENADDLLTTSTDDMGDGYFVATAMAESPTFNAPDGTPRKYIHALLNGETTQYMVDYRTFKDVQGNDRGQWLIEKIVPQDNALWIPDADLADVH